jgi:phosphate transport system protein
LAAGSPTEEPQASGWRGRRPMPSRNTRRRRRATGSGQGEKVRAAFQEQLSALTTALAAACGLVGVQMHDATRALLQADLTLAERVISDHKQVAQMSSEVSERAFVLLALQAPVAGDLRAVVSSIQIAADIERMGALAVHVAEIARRRHPDHAVPDEVSGYFAQMGHCAGELCGDVQQVLLSCDPRKAARIRHDDDAVDDLHRKLLGLLVEGGSRHGMAAAIDVALLARFYERFADHVVQIARRVIFRATGTSAAARV